MPAPSPTDRTRLQPPFPPHATSPDDKATPPPHPNAEAILNATAQHVFPEESAPPQETQAQEDVESSQLSPTTKQKERDGDEKRDEGQVPIVGGTPLDEMNTPMFERGPVLSTSPPLAGQPGSNGVRSAPRRLEKHSIGPHHLAQHGVSSTPSARAGEQHVMPGNVPLATKVDSPTRPGRPGFGPAREIGSVRMGASALISALNAIPWEGEEDDSSSSEDEIHDKTERKMGKSAMPHKSIRPNMNRLHSSLHTIRPMSTTPMKDDELVEVPPPNARRQLEHSEQSLRFPFRANTVARRAQSPGVAELEYQFAKSKMGTTQPGRHSDLSTQPQVYEGVAAAPQQTGAGVAECAFSGDVRKLVEERTAKEEEVGEAEESEEIVRASPVRGSTSQPPSVPLNPGESNVSAALREGDEAEDVMEARMEENPEERKRVRREKLGEKLMEVFGLEEREEVLEEMRCWLLRSVMLKGYMYLTRLHICFFAHMPDKENLIVKTGPLNKKASRTKLNTKFWVVLRNDVLSWFESTADPYFPKGNVSLQYASSCDAVDENRFKLRTSERNYTFTADTEASRDEWVKAIQKVMFRTQHEGECVKLIIPLEAVLELDRAPTLEFAETIEVRCVDPEDQMSVESYFFASFQNPDRAYERIQQVLEDRPSSDLPRVSSGLETEAAEHEKTSAAAAAAAQQAQRDNAGPLGLKKIGSVFKPLIPHTGDEEKDKSSGETKSGFSIPFLGRHKPSHDSLETLREDQSQHSARGPLEEEPEGYPPRQSGPAPAGLGEQKPGWGKWIKKPTAKIFESSPSQSSLLSRSPPSTVGTSPPGPSHRPKRESVTEVVEPAFPTGESDGDDELSRRGSSQSAGAFRRSRQLGSAGELHAKDRSDYDMMERSESGHKEDMEIEKKFRSVFSLSEKEELIEHFPGWLYRVLPVSGRFFVSTNYLCFRSSQLLYKTKMIIPIRDLYGLKAQRAFRFGHHGLIIVIKGHEELFLEFSSSKRRSACVTLLETRMEEVRLQTDGGTESPDADLVANRIMEDLDESSPMDMKRGEGTSPSPLFGSTTSTFLEFKPEPMRITCLTIGSRGDVQPYIALCKGLKAEGHHTRIATHGEYKDWVEGHGVEFASVGGDPAELMQMCVDNGMFTVSFLKEGIQKFRGWLDDLLHSSWEACQGSELLIESPSAMGGIHIAEALRIPYYRAFTMPWTRTRAYPHAFAVPEHRRGGSYNYMTYTMFDQVFWRAIAGQVNRFRRKTLGIDATTFDKLDQHKVPFLYNFSPNVVPPPLDWTEWIHVTGYWFMENSDESAEKESYTPPEGLLDFIDNAHQNGQKVVYIGFGSIVVSDPEEMTRCVVEAVVESGVCAILSKGWSDRGSKAKGDDHADAEGADGITYPPEIFSIDSIDHTWLFPRIDAACHHGGAGTSGASLRAGIPTIIKPFFGDQAFWSERVESLNVGSAVRKLTSTHLADALRQATTDEKQVAKAKVVGEMIRKENGVARAIEAIYRDLEYAKSLIKPPPEDKTLEKTHTTSSILSDIVKSRSRSESHPKSRSDSITEEHTSDESWSVVSERDGDRNGNGWLSSPDKVGRERTGSGGLFSKAH